MVKLLGSKTLAGGVKKGASNINKYRRGVVRLQFTEQRSLVTNSKIFFELIEEKI